MCSPVANYSHTTKLTQLNCFNMPKAAPKTTVTVRYAPYMPLRGVKVNSQLGRTKEGELLRATVLSLGGTMVGIQHSVDYIVANSGTTYGDFSMGEALEDFIGKHTNIYDSLILPEDMFERLNELMGYTLPVNYNTVTFRNTVYPIRASNYTKLGQSLHFDISRLSDVQPGDALVCSPELDMVALRYKKNERDVWKTTELQRYQICKNEAGTFYVVICMTANLFDAVHRTSGLSSYLSSTSSKYTFDTPDEAKACLAANYLQPALKVDCDHAVPGLKVKDDDDYFVEVLHVWPQKVE